VAFDLTRAVQRWKDGAATGQQRYVEGIQTTDSDPVANAIRAQTAMVSNFNESVTSGRWARNLGAVGKAGWQQASVAKAGNYSTGIAASGDKYQAAMQTWGPIIDSTAAATRQMPSGTLAQNLARANYFATQLYNRKRGQ
jgi:hypothetical protein